MTSPLPPFDWDIFCCVVDNFGDIGVTWRLARQLEREGHVPTHASEAEEGQGLAHGSEANVRLWVDDLASFARICPGLDPAQDGQWVAGIYIQHWRDALPADVIPAKVVIEAFACELPAPFIERMAGQPRPPWSRLAATSR
jgi:hypothetical protein